MEVLERHNHKLCACWQGLNFNSFNMVFSVNCWQPSLWVFDLQRNIIGRPAARGSFKGKDF
jgi:hypothetical protein